MVVEPLTRGSCDGCIYFVDDIAVTRVEHASTCGSIAELDWPVPAIVVHNVLRAMVPTTTAPDAVDELPPSSPLARVGAWLARSPHLGMVAANLPGLGRVVRAAAEAEYRDAVARERKARGID